MKYFCSYAFTGQDLTSTVKRARLVVDTLGRGEHEVYCDRFDPVVEELEKNDDKKAIFRRALDALRESDTVVAVVASPHKSVGQLIEVGAALDQIKPIYLLEHVSAKGSSYLPEIVTKTFEWDTLDDLIAALGKIP